MKTSSLPERLKRAKHYRARAIELRAMAKEWKSGEPRSTLVQLAESYDRMAWEIEQSLRGANQSSERLSARQKNR